MQQAAAGGVDVVDDSSAGGVVDDPLGWPGADSAQSSWPPAPKPGGGTRADVAAGGSDSDDDSRGSLRDFRFILFYFIFTTHTVMKINQEQKVKIHIL